MDNEKSISIMCPVKWYDTKIKTYLKKKSENQIRRFTLKELVYNAINDYIKRYPAKKNTKKA